VQIADAKPGMTLTPLLDIVPRVPVASGSVEWIFYPNTGPTAGKVTEGSAKPEAAVAPEVKTVSLDILAHWIQYTRSVFEDAPALMSYINMELRDGVLRKIEAEAVAALVADTDVPSTEYAAGGTLMEGIRLGIATVQQAGFYPNAVLLNPADYADLDLSLLGQTVVNTGTGPQIGQTYWGVRPIPSAGVTAGTAYLGDFSTGMANLMRSDVSVYTTDSHASTFTSNVLTTLAEVRAATVVHRPEALTVITEAPAA
jgi:HK97 family phage major capsid protein